MAVDDRDDRLRAGLRGTQDLVLLRPVTAGIDDDQALRRIEDDAVAVGLASFLERAGNHQIGFAARRRGAQAKSDDCERLDHSHRVISPVKEDRIADVTDCPGC